MQHTSQADSQAQKCCITVSIGSRQTGHESPLAFKTRAQIKQHAIWPVSPCTIVAVLSSERQMRQRLGCAWSNEGKPFLNKFVEVTIAEYFDLSCILFDDVCS